MTEQTGDLWSFHRDGHTVAITTNGIVNRADQCVMGRGVAFQAKVLMPGLPLDLGLLIKKHGMQVEHLTDYRIVAFPVKYHWSEPADLELIARSANQAVALLDSGAVPKSQLYLPRPGCGDGKLDWGDVKRIIAPILDNRFVIVNY